jgi:hypothetical protein
MEVREHLREHGGLYGWAAVGAVVVAAEILSPQTLSTASKRVADGEYGHIASLAWKAFLPITGAHLVGKMPHMFDPYEAIGNVASRFGLDNLSITEWRQ